MTGSTASFTAKSRTAKTRRQYAAKCPSGAIQQLRSPRQLVRKPGVSTPVVTAKVRRPIELASLYDDVNTAGRDSHTSVLSFTITLRQSE